LTEPPSSASPPPRPAAALPPAQKGRELVELDLVIVAGDQPRPVAHILHTAICRLPALA